LLNTILDAFNALHDFNDLDDFDAMNDIAIRVENLSKLYHIGQRESAYKTLRESIMNLFNRRDGKSDTIWALKDVSFEVKRGEVVGIIGRNGSGKTTLLKILSRITEPTEGYAEVRGRVGSLLEVGIGFHPELTGRENIFLNGAILGMGKSEIQRKFDEIMAFAEIEKFMDTPVKRYSSGMYVRLAFAVAAHLEPEILLVDEVLAVGDFTFQKKCLGKMRDVAQEGRTVLFVSHNLQAIGQLCPRTILLEDGRLLKNGATQEILNIYTAMASSANNLNGDLSSPKLRLSISDPASLFKWTDITVINSQGQPTSQMRFGEPFEMIFRGHASKSCESVIIGLGVISKILGPIFSTHQLYNDLPDTLPEGVSEFHVKIDPNILAPGLYEVYIGAVGPGVADYIAVSMEFNILSFGITPDKLWHAPHQAGVVDYPCKWSVRSYPAIGEQ